MSRFPLDPLWRGLAIAALFEEGTGDPFDEERGRLMPRTGATWDASPQGAALAFDGVDDYVDLERLALSFSHLGDLTVLAYLLPNGTYPTEPIGELLLGKTSAGEAEADNSPWSVRLRQQVGQDPEPGIFWEHGAGVNDIVSSSLRLTPKASWHLVGWARDTGAKVVRFAVDGRTEQVGYTNNPTGATAVQDIWLCRDPGSPTSYAQAGVGLLLVWMRALEASELALVTTDFWGTLEAGARRFFGLPSGAPPPPVVVDPGLFVGGALRRWIGGTLSVDDRVEERSVASFEVWDEDGALAFRRGEPVTYRDPVLGEVFSGVVETSEERKLGPGDQAQAHEVTAVDWHYLADKRVVAKSYLAQSCGAIVRDLRTTYLAAEGVVEGTIEDGPTLSEVVFNYVPVARALEALAELANFTWYIDLDKALHFRSRTTLAAPFTLTRPDCLAGSIRVKDASPTYRNRQYIRGGQDITDPQVESYKGDGARRTFNVGFPVAEVPAVKVNTVTKTVGIRGVETGKDWYWNKGSTEITQDSAGVALGTTDTLEVTYKGHYDMVVISTDQAEVDLLKAIEGVGTGLVEEVADDPQLSGRQAGFEKAAGFLATHAVRGKVLTFDTRRTGLRPGQLLTVDLPDEGLEGVKMLVEAITLRKPGGPNTAFGVTAVIGPVSGSWAKALGSLIAPAVTPTLRVNISEQQVLVILAPFSETWAWGEVVTPLVRACKTADGTWFADGTYFPC